MPTQYRFDLVISSCDRCEVFWDSLDSLKNMNISKDRIIFMDCSRNSKKELEKCLNALKILGLEKIKFYFFKRRKWNFNQGAQLDYIRLVAEKKLEKPMYTYFMQDHYLNKKILIKGDSIPRDEFIDLNKVEKLLSANRKIVFFCSKIGFRISSIIRNVNNYYTYSDSKDINTAHLNSLLDICFVIDGSNFCLDIAHYFDHYWKHKKLYTSGNSYGHTSGGWETRLCKILYDQGLIFYDKHRNLKYKTTSELKSKFPNPGKIWGYYYERPHELFLYGKDIYKYRFNLRKEYIEEMIRFIYFYIRYDRNITVNCIYPVTKRCL